MKLLGYLIPLAIIFTTAVDAYEQPAHAQPRAPVKHLKQAKKKEVELQSKYPELFSKRDSLPSGVMCGTRKRDLAPDFQILAPKEMAEFLVNRGIYHHANGTRLVDRHWIDEQDEAEKKAEERSRWSRALHSKLEGLMVNVGFHFYRRWKEHAANGPSGLYHVSNNVAFDVRDIPAIERALLDDPNFEEIKAWNYRLTRRLIEASHAAN
ncbi:hypothetical protein FRC00_002493 [Tulasnella sp. 408]|nr:hypothetical protein FRC00_002493 [Tulasnella sp. 408]